MKKTFLAIATEILMYSFSFAQTTISAGNVSGTWTFAGSPYLIQGAIMIPNDSILTIEPGVTVNFQGSYKLYIQGRVLAIGAVADTITFTAADTTIGWLGVQFDNTPTTNDTSKFFYCKLQYSKTTNGSGAFYFNNFSKAIISNSLISNCMTNTSVGGSAGISCFGGSPVIIYNKITHNKTTNIGALNGGGIYCWASSPVISNNIISKNSSNYGGGISCDNSSPVISNNVISKNTASLSGGGGIFCNNSNAKITNNMISDNSASTGGGGGIYIYSGSPVIINNTISNNTVYNAGGGIYCEYSSPTITNNTITNNSAANGGALFFTLYSSLSLHNNILWGNTASTSGQQVYLDDENSDPDFHYCDVQGGTAAFGLNGSIFYTGTYQNNIDTIPMFVSPSSGSGTGYNGVTADWSLQLGSPCINTGAPDTNSLGLTSTDLVGNPRISGGRIDIGAYEYVLPNSINEVIAPFLLGIYPNPATNNITIEIPQKSEIEILNINGQIIKTINNNNTKTTIDLENLSSGVYIIKAKTDRGIAMNKFIKE